MLKRRNILAWAMVLILLMSGFSSPVPSIASGPPTDTTFTEADGIATLENSLLELKWETTHGTLIGLRNKTTDTQYLSNAAGGNWFAWIDTRSGNKWNSSIFGGFCSVLRGRETPLTSITTEDAISIDGNSGIQVNLEYTLDFWNYDPANGVPGGKHIQGIKIIQHATMYDNDPITKWTTEVINPVETCVVVNAISTPQLTTLKDNSNNWNLVWPWKEGEIHPSAVNWYTSEYAAGHSPNMLWGYPVPMSMQFMYLYNNEQGLYYGVRDDKAAYKEFNFGLFTVNPWDLDYDLAHTDGSPTPLQMSVTFWPNIGNGESYETPVVDIGIQNDGNWYPGADLYRDWLINDAHWVNDKPEVVNTMTGWVAGFNDFGPKPEQGLAMPYSDLPSFIARFEELGIDILEMIGWHTDGFDSLYPDYDYISDAGGRQGLQDAIDLIHEQGDKVFFYVNNHVADAESRWYSEDDDLDSITNGEDSKLRDALRPGGFLEDYNNGRTFYAMCPAVAEWIDQLDTVAMDLRSMGADGIWWDQMLEMDAHLCLNQSHGHSSPDMAFAEGYKKMMEKITQDFSANGTNTNFIFASEGVNDYYSQYIDVNGMMWGRPYGYSPLQAPQITRYTIPAKFLGLQTAGKEDGADDQFAWAFTMGNPILVSPYYIENDNEKVLPRYPNIYKSEPEIYFYGTYKDEKGLALSNSNVKGTIIIGQNGDKLGVQLRNLTASSQTVTVIVDYAKLNIGYDYLSSVKNIEGGSTLSYTEGTGTVSFDVTVPASDVCAYKVTFSSDDDNTPVVSSSTYTVDDELSSISHIPYGTTYLAFTSALTPSAGSSFAVYQADGTTPVTSGS